MSVQTVIADGAQVLSSYDHDVSFSFGAHAGNTDSARNSSLHNRRDDT